MADDEGWGDDAGDGGWGDDNNAAASGDGGWGDAEANDDWGAAQEDTDMTAAGGDDDKELSVAMQIENAYYEADDNRLERNMSAALEQFEKVLELGTTNMADLADESLLFVFKSVRNIVSIHLQAGALEKMTKAYKSLLTFIPKVTRNEAQEAVSAVLHDLGEVQNKKFVQEMYKLTAETVQVLPDQERLWFRVSMKYCEYAFANGEYKEAEKKLEELLRSCRTPDGRDDLNKGSELLEIYALESRISAAEKDSVKLQALYEKTKNLNAAVKDPRSLSVIRECWGEMFADQGDWNRAYQEFYLAFTAYQEIGNSSKAKQCLKYVVIANMLSGGSSNPFDSREAKAFQNDKDIEAIGLLRQAYEKCDVARFNQLLTQITAADQFISKHLASMVRDFQSRAILQLIKSYRRVRLDYLAELLQVESSAVEALLVPLILDGQIVGKIDQARGLLDLSQSVGGGQKYLAIDRWTNALHHLRQQLPTPYQTR